MNPQQTPQVKNDLPAVKAPFVYFEVIQNYHLPFQKQQGEKVRTRQHIYMHNGGAFPVECVLDLAGPSDALPIGKYTLLPNVFQVGKYGSPEVNNWEIRNNLVSLI